MSVEGAFFDGHVGVQVDVGGTEVGVTEPEGDDGGVDPGLQQRHGAAVTQHVGWSSLRPERGTSSVRRWRVQADEALRRRRAEPSSGAGREQRVVGPTAPFGEPDPEHGLGGRGERNGPRCLRPLPSHRTLAPVAENDVVAVESDEFGHSQPGLDRQQQQRAVSAAFPADRVGCGEQGVDLGGGEKRHDPLVEPLWPGSPAPAGSAAACSG